MRTIALVAAVACTACTYTRSNPDTTTVRSAGVPQGPVAEIRLERTACFHSCPEYSVSITDDGDVRYRGIRSVARPGVHTGAIPMDSAAALFRFADSVHFENLAGQYVQGTRGCDPYVADLPGVIITVVRANGGTRVEGDPGCPSMPTALVTLATMIDHMVRVERWTAGR